MFPLLALFLLIVSGSPGKKRFFLKPTLRLPPDTVYTSIVTQEDSIPNDTLFQVRSEEGFPLAYYRKINTNVCFDGKCRMLKVRLYWNITGRYLGLELPEGEFLSKSDHEPFTSSEYRRMNELLADSLSPLGSYSFEELVPSTGAAGLGVDAVTSATAPAMSDYVIGGAAYTTLKLWHFVYGPTRDETERLTEKALSPELLRKILESPDMSDVAWAFQRIQTYSELDPALLNTVISFIRNDDYSLAAMAVEAINPADLASATLQNSLLEKFTSVNYSLKNKIIDKLKEAPRLDRQASALLAQELKTASGSLMGNILELFTEQEVTDKGTCRIVSGLLTSKNDFIARNAFDFLEKIQVEDDTIRSRMAVYRSRTK